VSERALDRPKVRRGEGGAPEGEAAGLPQQFVRYSFFRVDPAWRRLPSEERRAQRREFAERVEAWRSRMLLEAYSLAGTRGDCDFMLWQATPALSDLYDLAADLNGCALAAYLTLPHSYLSVTRRSIYVRGHVHDDQPERRLEVRMGEKEYLIVYPFVKTRPWYKLTQGARQGMMAEHIRIGHRFPEVRIHTTYSYGLDDQEFVLAFDCDDPRTFVDLMMELRLSEASAYTLRDVPSFTCRRMPIGDALAALG
jgi:chlorite dismutase